MSCIHASEVTTLRSYINQSQIRKNTKLTGKERIKNLAIIFELNITKMTSAANRLEILVTISYAIEIFCHN